MLSMKWVGSLAIAGMVLAAVACGDSKSSLNPTAPSAVTAAAQNQEGGNAGGVSSPSGKGNGGNPGNGNGNGKPDDKGKPDDNGKPDDKGKPDNPGNGNQPPSSPAPGAPTPGNTTPTVTKVEIEGLIGSIAGSSISVNSRMVMVPFDAIIRHGNRAVLFSELQVGDRVHVKAKSTNGNLEATEVMVQNPAGDGNDEDPNEDGSATVNVSLFDASASETGGDTGTFRLTRTPSATLPLSSPLTVSFTLGGTATNGLDYTMVPLTATFAAGAATVDVVVAPIADALAEGNETVVLTLTNATPYKLGSPTSATVTISEAPAVSVAAFDSSASETPGPTGPDTATFRLSRTGSTAAPLTVTVTLTGTATNGVDYTLVPLTVTFAAGSATADVVITPIADAVVEGSETVIITVVDGAAYDLGTPATATATIAG